MHSVPSMPAGRFPSYRTGTPRPLTEPIKRAHTRGLSLQGVRRTPPADVVEQVSAIFNRAADEESGFVPPSLIASLGMIRLLTGLVGAPQVSSISDDGEGGLEAYWVGTTRHVQLNVPGDPKERTTIFWDGDGDYRVEPLNSLSQLSARLKWFREA
jgi:hypothetical protein